MLCTNMKTLIEEVVRLLLMKDGGIKGKRFSDSVEYSAFRAKKLNREPFCINLFLSLNG